MNWNWLKHAFAVETDEGWEPTQNQREIVDRLCRQIVSRGMTTPALVFLETVRPLNYLSSQTMQFFAPILAVVADADAYSQFAEFLEHRGSVEYLCRRIETISSASN